MVYQAASRSRSAPFSTLLLFSHSVPGYPLSALPSLDPIGSGFVIRSSVPLTPCGEHPNNRLQLTAGKGRKTRSRSCALRWPRRS